MRIVAGKFRGARIEAPKGLATRPTSDRVRQALFNVLEHGAPGFDFDGARVLDLFAGSGALGLEACRAAPASACSSRTAPRRARPSAAMWRRCISPARPRSGGATRRSLGLRARCRPSTSCSSIRLTARTWGKGASIRREGGWIREGAVAVLEERADAEIVLPPDFEEIDTRVYGDTKLIVMRAFPAARRRRWLRPGEMCLNDRSAGTLGCENMLKVLGFISFSSPRPCSPRRRRRPSPRAAGKARPTATTTAPSATAP